MLLLLGIIYCRTRAACTELAGRLVGKKISAKAYHAGLKNTERDEIQEDWMQGRVKVIVATISFGIWFTLAGLRRTSSLIGSGKVWESTKQRSGLLFIGTSPNAWLLITKLVPSKSSTYSMQL